MSDIACIPLLITVMDSVYVEGDTRGFPPTGRVPLVPHSQPPKIYIVQNYSYDCGDGELCVTPSYMQAQMHLFTGNSCIPQTVGSGQSEWSVASHADCGFMLTVAKVKDDE